MKKVISFFVCVMLTACAQDINSNSYSASAVGQTDSVEHGVIVSVRAVDIQGSDSPVGMIAGGTAGGFAGSTIGHGGGSVLAAVGGALAGAFLGNFTQKELTELTANQYFIKMNSGKTISVIQGKENPLTVGQHVSVIFGQVTKIIPD